LNLGCIELLRERMPLLVIARFSDKDAALAGLDR
jgi:hypothetical protein